MVLKSFRETHWNPIYFLLHSGKLIFKSFSQANKPNVKINRYSILLTFFFHFQQFEEDQKALEVGRPKSRRAVVRYPRLLLLIQHLLHLLISVIHQPRKRYNTIIRLIIKRKPEDNKTAIQYVSSSFKAYFKMDLYFIHKQYILTAACSCLHQITREESLYCCFDVSRKYNQFYVFLYQFSY